MPQTVCVGAAGDFPDGGSAVVEVNGKDVAVFRDGDQFYAIDDRCPHAGASLAAGSVSAGVVTCPWHHWRFRLSDGAWADNPRIKTACYAVRVENGMVILEVP